MKDVLRWFGIAGFFMQFVIGVVLAISTLVAGAIAGAIFGDPTHPYISSYWNYLYISGSVAIICGLSQITSSALFPKRVADNLNAEVELRKANDELARVGLAYRSIDISLQALNAKTCSISSERNSANQDLCLQDIQQGIESVLSPLVNDTKNILGSGSYKYCVGVFLTESPSVSVLSNERKVIYEERISVLRDDLSFTKVPLLINNAFQTDFFSYLIQLENSLSGGYLELAQSIKKVFQNKKECLNYLTFDNKKYHFIGSPIPQVCEGEYYQGVIFVISDKCDVCITGDMPNTLMIFGRILANWLAKYTSCLQDSVDAYNKSLSSS